MKSIHYGILGITTMLATLSPQMAEALEKIGVVGLAGTTVTATDADGAARTLKTGDAVYLNDHLVSDAGGKAQLIFLDRSTLTLNANTDLTLDTYVYDPAAANGTMAVSSVKGAFRFVGGALSKKQPVTIKTPVATIGIRGGIADTNVQPGGATDAVFVYGEQLSMTNQNGETSVTTQIGTGLMLDNPGGIPAPMPPEMVNQRMQAFGGAAPEAGGEGGAAGGQSNNTGSGENSSGSGNSGSANNNSGGGASGNSGGGVTVQLVDEDGAPAGAPITFFENVGDIAGDAAQDVGTEVVREAVIEGDESVLPGVTDIPQVAENLSLPPSSEGEVATGDDPNARPPEEVDVVDDSTDPDPDPSTNPNTGGGTPVAVVVRRGHYEYRESMAPANNSDYDVIVGRDETNNNYEQIVHADATLPGGTGTPLVDGNGALLVGMVDKFTPGLHSVSLTGVRPITGGTSLAAANYSGQTYTSPSGGMTYLQLYGPSEKQITSVYGDWIQHSLQPDFTTALVDARNRSASASNAAGFGGVSFYNFLPHMAQNHHFAPKFGFFDYNIADAGLLFYFGGTAGNEVRGNAPGLMVDWQHGVALGMDLEFIASGDSKPSATLAIGRVDNTGGGTGDYLKGSIQKFVGQQLTTVGISSITKNGVFTVGDEIYGRPDKPIEGMVIDYGYDLSTAPALPWTNTGTQGAVIAAPPAGAAAAMGGQTGGHYKGFAGGVVKHNVTNYATYSSDNPNDVTLNLNTGNRTVNGNIALQERTATSAPDMFSGTFGSDSDTSKSAYISDKVYAAEQVGGTIDTRNAGFIVSGKAANVGVECTNCQYTRWGVWAAGGTAGGINTSAEMIPYVVGSEVTQNFNATRADALNAATGNTGTAIYNGAAYGNFVKDTAGTQYLQNAAGSMNATVDLANREVDALNMNFGSVLGSNLSINTTAPSSTIPATGDATFNNANVAVNWGGIGGTGAINGALFGPNAEEMGGNFAIEKVSTSTITGAGVFHGKR